MASKMIERAARAMWEEACPGMEWGDEDKMYYLQGARIAIAALREPTETMLHAARDWSIKKNGRGVGDDQATGCWQAMLDATLSDD